MSADGREQKSRLVGLVMPHEDFTVLVEHVWLTGTDEDGRTDPGMAGVHIAALGEEAGILLPARDALELANRIQRAAEMCLESIEDVPDPNREYQRWNRAEDRGDDEA